ncbi:MAG: molybdopterin biosynthesis protein, partial [Rhodobacteraceae bacterium]|nr:molybdopterin biosynthesis protein [Paracoccaceae bacterium]
FTGRANLAAMAAGVVAVDAARVAAINRNDAGITLATVAPWARVAAGGLAATVKILPYAVPGAALARAVDAAAGALRLHRVVLRDAGLILTEVPGQGARLAEKAERATAARLARLGMGLCRVVRVAHRTEAIAAALATLPGDMALILTGSATSDARDAGPAALVAAGGRLERFGLPVDPGNLTFWGTLGGRPVLGMPGSARSPVASGVDLVLDRLACGVAIDAEAVAAMGVGGLGRELPVRGHPREPRSPSRERMED